MDDGPTYGSTHQLLLGLAGHVDDDLLCWVRELVAVGEEARAVSLVTAGVVAERIQLPAPVRAALVDAGRAARSGIDPVELAPAAEPTVEHRFAAAPAGATDVAAAIRALPARQLQGTTVQLAWRLTPAGTAPGPLPHPVVLVEIDPVRHSGEMLAYLVASGLARGGVHASVEVVAAGQAHTGYHEAALAAAVPVAVGEPAEAGLATAPLAVRRAAPAAEEEPVEDVAEEVAAEALEPAAVTAPVRITTPEDVEAADAAEAEEEAATADDVEDTVEQDADDDEEPDEEPESVLDPNERHPFADVPPAPSARRRPPVAGVPALSALSDPLSGPLSEPLLAPLLDPTIHAHDPLGVDHLVGPSRHPFAPVEPVDRTPEPTPAPEPEEEPAPEPTLAAVPDPEPEPVDELVDEQVVEDSWAAEWASGAWAMPVDELGIESADTTATGAFDAEPPVEAPRGPRHGFAPQDELTPPPAQPPAAPAAPQRPAVTPDPAASPHPAVQPPAEPPRPRPAPTQRPAVRGPRRVDEPRPEPPAPRAPEPPRQEQARLSEADRELLARLQAELVEGRKPRAPRRPGAPAGGRASNGRGPDHRESPPENAS